MESYYSQLLKAYTSERPFVSLIFGKSSTGQLSATGRIFWKDKWYSVNRFVVENRQVSLRNYEKVSHLSEEALGPIRRLASQFSLEAAEALAGATGGIVGASGAGSPCVELLARAGVGKIIVVDPEVFEDSNLERVHGSAYTDIASKTPKVSIAGRHIKSINPDCEVVLIKGRIPRIEVFNQLLLCDILLGCTDLHSSRVTLSDLSKRFLLPVIDVGVLMEGKEGVITGQVIQVNRLFPTDPCVYCRNMVNSRIVSQELMTPQEVDKYRGEAEKAKEEGRNPQLYWIDVPQLNTVGYLTTMAGGLVVAYVIGYLTNRVEMKSNRVEIALSPHGIKIVERTEGFDVDCRCSNNCGVGDQDVMAIVSSSPEHWPEAEILTPLV